MLTKRTNPPRHERHMREAAVRLLPPNDANGQEIARRGSDEQMFGAEEQVPHGGPSDKEQCS